MQTFQQSELEIKIHCAFVFLISLNFFSDEEMSPRTKHKRSASTESPRCLMSNDFPSFIEPGSREVPVDVEMTDG